MKRGDKVYCIKDVKNYHNNKNVKSHKKGKIYFAYSDSDIHNNGEYVYITSEPNTTNHGFLGFIIIKHDDNGYYNEWDELYKHFADNQTIRKMKLEKIENLKLINNK